MTNSYSPHNNPYNNQYNSPYYNLTDDMDPNDELYNMARSMANKPLSNNIMSQKDHTNQNNHFPIDNLMSNNLMIQKYTNNDVEIDEIGSGFGNDFYSAWGDVQLDNVDDFTQKCAKNVKYQIDQLNEKTINKQLQNQIQNQNQIQVKNQSRNKTNNKANNKVNNKANNKTNNKINKYRTQKKYKHRVSNNDKYEHLKTCKKCQQKFMKLYNVTGYSNNNEHLYEFDEEELNDMKPQYQIRLNDNNSNNNNNNNNNNNIVISKDTLMYVIIVIVIILLLDLILFRR